MSKLKGKKPTEVGPGHCKGLLFGKPGAGKTWFALNFPTPFYIDTEGGASLSHYLKKLEVGKGAYLGPDDGSCDFDTIIDQIKALATEKHPYKTVIIDSITKVFQSAIAKEAERLGSKDAFGASKKPAVGQMRRLLNIISRLDMNVWFIAHEVAEWGGTGNDRKEIGKAPDVWDKLTYELHLAMRVEHVSKGLRVAHITKSRLLGFPEYDRIILQDGDKDIGYEDFSKRYGLDYIEKEVTQLVLCSKEQVEDINRLIGVLKLEENEVDKILSKANAESFADLTLEQAEKFIKYLENKTKKEEKDNAKN
jgi:hypothetical protein